MSAKVLVVDLDGTLLNVNTFHEWLKFITTYFAKSKKLYKLFRMLLLISLRLCRFISHSHLKKGVMEISCNLEKSLYAAFANQLLKSDNNLRKYLEDKIFTCRILATAAPEFYASTIAQNYEFDYCLATKNPNQNQVWKENIRENKLESVVNLLRLLNVKKIDLLITDHFDDFPLMEISNTVYLVRPNERTVNYLKTKEVKFRQII